MSRRSPSSLSSPSLWPVFLGLIAVGGSQLAACGKGPQPISIEFAAQVNGAAFACGQSYPGIGTSATQIQPADFRFYVHDVRLVDSDGSELPLTLDQDLLWQYQNVALLDFENKTAPCDGTAETNTTLRGQAQAPSGSYSGLRFRLGVPVDLNHGNQATAPSPLNFTSLFWTWQSGYKFLRTEGALTGTMNNFMVHLGSTGCTRDPAGQTSCTNLNTPEIELTGFDPQKNNRVVADLSRLLAGSNLSTDMACMSDPGSSDCAPVFSRLGLPWDTTAAGTQRFFAVE